MPATVIRTCVGCRNRCPRDVLLRVVLGTDATDAVVEVDEARRKPGRGAWVHPTEECIELAIRRRAFARALRAPSAVRISGLAEFVSARNHEY